MDRGFDPKKDAVNIERHGHSLSEFERIQNAVVFPAKTVDGEVRYKIVGRIDAQIVSVIVTERAYGLRPISLRLASRKERKDYASYKAR